VVLGMVAWLLGGSLSAASPGCTCLCMIPPLDTIVHLQRGDSAITVVYSRRLHDHTRIQVDAGGTYALEAVGYWHDSSIRTDASGYRIGEAPWYGRPVLAVGTLFRRRQHARYFALVGQVGDRSNARFTIGTKRTWTAPSTGELVTFANDVRFKYGNNRGCVALTVVRRS
jgi:hypothetical protein